MSWRRDGERVAVVRLREPGAVVQEARQAVGGQLVAVGGDLPLRQPVDDQQHDQRRPGGCLRNDRAGCQQQGQRSRKGARRRAADHEVITTSTLQGECSIRAPEIEPRHQRAAQLSRCLWPTTTRLASTLRAYLVISSTASPVTTSPRAA